MSMIPGDRIVATRFPLGRRAMMSNAAGRLSPEEIAAAIARHARGHRRQVSPEDATENELGLREGRRRLSAFGRRECCFRVITAADRSATTVLMREDY